MKRNRMSTTNTNDWTQMLLDVRENDCSGWAEYLDEIKKLVEEKQSKGWEFVFYGANIDAFTEGSQRGFIATKGFNASAKGVRGMYTGINASVTQYRTK